jgi:hypothetical protein
MDKDTWEDDEHGISEQYVEFRLPVVDCLRRHPLFPPLPIMIDIHFIITLITRHSHYYCHYWIIIIIIIIITAIIIHYYLTYYSSRFLRVHHCPHYANCHHYY